MDFNWTPEQESIRREMRRLCARFDDDYWLEQERSHTFPEQFYQAEAMQAELQPQHPLLYSLQGFQYCDLLLAPAEHTAWTFRW